MEIDVGSLTPQFRYKLLAGCVVPRPIAWTTTISDDGLVNLAPFSFFTVLSTDPALVGIAISDRPSGKPKDTFRNIKDRGDFVVNIAGEALAEKLHQSGADYPPNVSEAQALGLATIASSVIAAPRLEVAPISFECRLDRLVPLSRHQHLVVGKVLVAHVRQDVATDALRVRYDRLRPLGRLIAGLYLLPGAVQRYETVPVDPEADLPLHMQVDA